MSAQPEQHGCCSHHTVIDERTHKTAMDVATIKGQMDMLLTNVNALKVGVYTLVATAGAGLLLALGSLAFTGARHTFSSDARAGERDQLEVQKPFVNDTRRPK